jgi:hypothetical protein
MVVLLSAILILSYAPGAVAQNANATPAATAGGHVAPTPERINQLAHQLLSAAVKVNGLADGDLKPWHMKVDFEMLPDSSAAKPVSGTMEEWYLDRYHWRRTYTSPEPTWRGSEWRVGKAHRYVTKRRFYDFEEYWLTSRIGRPVVNPLYQADNVRAQDELVVQRVQSNGLALNCASLAKADDLRGRMPEWIVPTMCFDSDLHVRLMRSENIYGQFFDLQPFQGQAVARDVKLIVGNRVCCDMKVSLLETVDKVDEALLKPDADAVERPYMLERGDPQPVATYQVGASIPLVGGMPPYRGSLAFPVILRKDGSVKVEAGVMGGPMQYIWDAIDNAVSRWKYQPYSVDGEPVEVEFRVIYNVDGKPFVPQVERQ